MGNSALAYVSVAALALSIFFVLSTKDKHLQKQMLIWTIGACLPILAAFGISFWVPMFHPKYLLYSQISIFFLLSIGLTSIATPKWLRWGSSISLVILFGLHFSIHQAKSEDWKATGAYIHSAYPQQPMIMVSVGYQCKTFLYHYDRDLFEHYDHPFAHWYKSGVVCIDQLDESFFTYNEAKSIVLLQSHWKSKDPENKTLSLLKERYVWKEEKRFKGVTLNYFAQEKTATLP